MKHMKKVLVTVITVALVAGLILAIGLSSQASDLPFENLFKEGFAGYTSDEGEILTAEFVSSKAVSVSSGETVWFGPCQTEQYFQLVGQDGDGTAVTDKIRGKELTVADTFGNETVIYQYTVPDGVEKLVFSVPAGLKDVFVISKTEVTAVNFLAFWKQQGVDTDGYVGQNSYYEVSAGDKLYFGAITEADALSSVTYDGSGSPSGTIASDDLRLVESFGGTFGIYCYTVPSGSDVSYIKISYDSKYEQYYNCYHAASGEEVSDELIVDSFIDSFGVVRLLESTVEALSGKTALFLGDSITYGARDRANIYGCGGWAGRIGYYAGMSVTNNGVSGACISTARRESNSEAHYIYNNLIKTQGTTYDYVIMHGLFNDASEDVPLGTMQGKDGFDPAKADVTTYAGGLELLFYQARVQNPDAILGFIVNFETERSVDQQPYVELAIAICEDWGIEYLDLYNRPGFSVEFDDGLHPSSAGYDSMYTLVANWMAGLGKDETVTSTGSSANVMSYNVFWNAKSKAGEPYAAIEDRTGKVLSLIGANDPDILLLQEVTGDWIDAIDANAAAYSGYGYCHKCAYNLENGGGNSGCSHEMAPIYWKSDKYDLVESGHFWASSTPEAAGSASWDNGASSSYPRCVNWVVLKDKQTGGELVVMNYHADPNDETIRNLSARLVVDKLDELCKAYDAPAVIGGDWNMAANSTAYSITVGNGLTDVRYAAETTTSIGSYNAWTRVDTSKYALGDYLFFSDGLSAESFRVITDDWADEAQTLHISDHSPIVAEIEY